MPNEIVEYIRVVWCWFGWLLWSCVLNITEAPDVVNFAHNSLTRPKNSKVYLEHVTPTADQKNPSVVFFCLFRFHFYYPKYFLKSDPSFPFRLLNFIFMCTEQIMFDWSLMTSAEWLPRIGYFGHTFSFIGVSGVHTDSFSVLRTLCRNKRVLWVM